MPSTPPQTLASPPAPRRRTQAERSAAASRAILDATLDRLRESGPEVLTMAEVAARAGVSKGLVHYHFETKEQLLLAAQNEVFQSVFDSITAMADDLEPSLERAGWGLDQLWHQVIEARETIPVILHLATQAVGQPAFRRAFDDFAARNEALLVQGIRIVLGPLESELEVPVETLARMIIASLVGLGAQLWIRNDPQTVHQAYQAFRTTLLGLVPGDVPREGAQP